MLENMKINCLKIVLESQNPKCCLVPHPLSPLLSIRNSSGSSSFPIVNCQTEGKLSERRNLGREGGRALAANGRRVVLAAVA